MTSVTLPAAGATSAPSGACADPVRLLAHQGEAAHPFGQGLDLETFATDPVADRDLPLAHGVAALAEEHALDVAETGSRPGQPAERPAPRGRVGSAAAIAPSSGESPLPAVSSAGPCAS